jgi:hypothetical protein
MPVASNTDLAIASLADIATALTNPTAPNTIPLEPTELHTLQQMAQIFARRDTPPQPITTTSAHTPAPKDGVPVLRVEDVGNLLANLLVASTKLSFQG